MADEDETEVIVAAVALVISVVALLATFMQVLQQYYASAAGYSQCNSKVMGKWAETKTRRFRWEELRFEVQFDAPVIFVSPPDNKFGPVPGAPIHFLEGTEESLEKTWTELEMDARKVYAERSTKEQIHTADNERASWCILLSAIQRMEKDSRQWQEEQYKGLGPPGEGAQDLPSNPPTLKDHHTLTVALQTKRKSWDTMPASIAKPYATTTMCHLVEMMAALGVYWKEFDRKHDRYRAEGNGFMVLGERVSELGLMFSFQIYGKCSFSRNRVIPVDEVKELCFGFVPTIYRETLDQRRLEFPNDEPQNLSSLQMASRSDIGETLTLIGCNNNTVHYFTDEGKRTSHLFPVSFEILGMLSRTFHIEDSAFTYVPNPTPDRWDKRSVSLVQLLASYSKFVDEPMLGAERNLHVVARIQEHIKAILAANETSPGAPKLRLYKALHKALDDADALLTARKRKNIVVDEAGPGRPSLHKRDRSAASIPLESTETEKQERRRELVQNVMRSHIQEVMKLLNDRDDRDNQSLYVPDRQPNASPATSRYNDVSRIQGIGFEDMNAASPDERQHKFMEVYFRTIRGTVHRHITRASNISAPPGYGLRRGGTGRTQATSIREAEDEAANVHPRPLTVNTSTDGPNDTNDINEVDSDNESVNNTDETKVPSPAAPLHGLEVSHDDVWCTLVFRMICWLMLHDFHKMDVQVSKSELLGSRMPVYIA